MANSRSSHTFRRRLFFQRLECRDTPNSYIVTATTDSGLGSGLAGDLRYCINQANANPGADTINFALSGAATITLGGNSLDLTDISGGTTINGLGADKLTIDANGLSRVMFVNVGTTVSLSGLTLTGGKLTYNGALGGGVYSQGQVAFDNCAITNNQLTGDSTPAGAGVFLDSGSSATFTDCTISNNSTANGNGGGMFLRSSVAGGSSVTLTNSTVSGNSDGIFSSSICSITLNHSTVSNNLRRGIVIGGNALFTGSTISGNSYGGIFNGGNATITNSTITGNVIAISSFAGGIFNVGNLTLTNSTVSGNSAGGTGGGIRSSSGSVTMTNTIVAGNSAPSNPDLSGSFTQNHCLVNMSAAAAGLGTLGNYGGPTQTISLLPGSPAIDAGGSTTLTMDQRGNPRVQFATVDIGAFEANRADLNLPFITAPDGAAWYVGPNATGDQTVYRETSGFNQQQIGGLASRIGITGNTVTVQNSNGDIFARIGSANGPGSTFQLLPSVAAADGAKWFLAADGPDANNRYVYRWAANSEVEYSGGFGTRLGVTADGSVVTENPLAGSVFIRTGSATGLGNAWQQVAAVTAGDGAKWFLSTEIFGGNDRLIYRWMSNESPTYSIGAGVSLNVSNGNVQTTTESGSRYMRVGSKSGLGTNWVALSESLVVTTLTDEDDGTSTSAIGTGTSLREALHYAESNSNADTITFAANIQGQTIAVVDGWTTGLDTAFYTNTNLTVDGGNGVIINLSAPQARRMFANFSTGFLTLTNLTISGGDIRTLSDGGAIWNSGRVDLINAHLTNNKANSGGAIVTNGTLNVFDSILDNNSTLSAGVGGAIYVAGGVCNIVRSNFLNNQSFLGGAINSVDGLTITDSTFAGNMAGFNGGALRLFGTSNISGTTISNNTATNGGGGLISHGNTTITSSTIAYNAASDGGGAQFFEGTGNLHNVTVAYNLANNLGGGAVINFADVTMTNTLIASNVAGSGPDVYGIVNPSSSNNVVNMTAAAAGIGSFGYFGGPTATIALLPGSPAINMGNSTITTDQRGKSRVGMSDIGAFESQGYSIAIVSGSSQSTSINTAFVSPLVASVSSSAGEPVDGGVVTFFAPSFGASAAPLSQTVTISGGLAMSGTLIANGTAGKYNVTASSSGAAPANFQLTNVAVPSKINGIVIGDGTNQRSMVNQLVLNFDSAVAFAGAPASAFQLFRQSDNSAVTLAAAVNPTNTQVTLTFTGGAVDNKSLADGRYTLTVLANQFASGGLDGDGNGIAGDDYVLASAAQPNSPTNIFRLFGDANGDGTVAANDFIQFRLALGGSNSMFDFDGDGAVAASDFIQFRLRFGGSI